MNEASKRQRRVADLLKKEVSRIILEELRDPRIAFVTVSDVEISPDLRQAKVSVNVLGGEKERTGSLAGLNNAAPYIRTQVAALLTLRHVPAFRFYYDDSIDRYERINTLLKEAGRGNE